MFVFFSELPAPIRVEVRGIADTSNFDDFGDSEMIIRKFRFTNSLTITRKLFFKYYSTIT